MEMDAVGRQSALIYDLQYWRRFSHFPSEICKNLFWEVHHGEKSQ